MSFTPFYHYICPEHSTYIQFSLILSQETRSSQAPHTANTAGLNKFQSVKWNDPILGERLPCREVCHEEFWDQLLEGDLLVRVLRTDDVLLLHCSQHTVLHVKVVNAASIIVCQLVLAQWGAEGTGGVLLYEETPITLTGCQSYNTYTGYAACFSFSDSGFQIWMKRTNDAWILQQNTWWHYTTWEVRVAEKGLPYLHLNWCFLSVKLLLDEIADSEKKQWIIHILIVLLHIV